MNLHNIPQFLSEFSKLKTDEHLHLNDIFYRVFKSKEFDECEHNALIAYLAMRVKLLENRVEKLESYIHG
jgi:hypothetical protein